MGTRTNVFLSTDGSLLRNTGEVLRRLHLAEVESLSVAKYWRRVEPDGYGATEWTIWEDLGDRVTYQGPGSLGLDIIRRGARLHAGARWRGFLSIPPLRSVHLSAFRSIAAALGADVMVITHDSVEAVYDVFETAGLDGCIALLQETMGAPQPDVESVDSAVVAETEESVPDVWYLEQVSGAQ